MDGEISPKGQPGGLSSVSIENKLADWIQGVA